MTFAVEEEMLHDSWDDFPVQPGSISELMAMPRSAESEPEPLPTAPAVAELPPVQLSPPLPPPRPTETEETHTSLIDRVFSLMRRPR